MIRHTGGLASGAPDGPRSRSRSGGGGAAGEPSGMPDHGLRQVQVRAGYPAEGSPQEAVQDRGQGDQVPPEDRSARLRHEEGARRPVPDGGRAGQGDHHVPRARDGPHGARAQDPRSAPGGSEGPRGRRGGAEAGWPEHDHGHRADEEADGEGRVARRARPGGPADAGSAGVEMPKMKTHRATAKRFRITRTGKVLHRKATGNHMLTKKSGSRRRRVEGMAEVTAERTAIRRLLGK